MTQRSTYCGAALLAATLIPAAFAERIVVVGDSITGHSKNLGGKVGYYYRFTQALDQAGVKDVTLVPLGGSGHSVSSWRGVVKKSYEKNEKLDIPGIFTKDELDKEADTVIIFLGMNDVLCPYTNIEKAGGWWKGEYQKLIDALKQRTKFKKLILAPPTFCTENPDTYRNRLGDELARQIELLAKENNAAVAPTRSAFADAWKNMRMSSPTRHITIDYVHPNQLGHGVIAAALLRAVGQNQAADLCDAKNKRDLGAAAQGKPGMLLYVVNNRTPDTITVKGELGNIDPAAPITATLPDGWKLAKIDRDKGAFTLSIAGRMDRLTTPITVEAKAADGTAARQTLKLAAPFRVVTNLPAPRWFSAKEFDADKLTTAVEKQYGATDDFKTPARDWLLYYPTADVTGGDNPNSVDFASFDDVKPFAQGIMYREIQSDKGGKALLKLSTRKFAGHIGATVWLNGKRVFAGFLDQNRAETEVELKPGWNTLAVKCSHTTWQFQMAAELAQVPGGADIAALRYRAGGEPAEAK